jgi:hypothetical protein
MGAERRLECVAGRHSPAALVYVHLGVPCGVRRLLAAPIQCAIVTRTGSVVRYIGQVFEKFKKCILIASYAVLSSKNIKSKERVADRNISNGLVHIKVFWIMVPLTPGRSTLPISCGSEKSKHQTRLVS